MRFVKVDGSGDPNTSHAYTKALEWLYAVSFGMKFAAKEAGQPDDVVPPLEGPWWSDDPSDFVARRKERWQWTMMILAPEFLSEEVYQAAVEKVRKKRGVPPSSLRFEPYREGLSLQILHVGSYDDEGPMLAKLHHDERPTRGVPTTGFTSVTRERSSQAS